MSDEDLIVRHVKLCECGKPAGHGSICRPSRTAPGLDPDDVQRVPEAFEDTTSERAHGRFDRRRRDFDTERRHEFAQMSPLRLHRWVVEHAAALSTVSAGSMEAIRSASHDTAAPPRQQTLDDDPRYREHLAVIRRRLEFAVELILEAEGHGTVGSTANMIGAEKDALICHPSNEGLRAQAVVDRLGSHIAGSARTVQRVRRDADLDHLGCPRDR